MIQQMSIPSLLICLGLTIIIFGMEVEEHYVKLCGGLIGLFGWILQILLALKVI